MYPFERFTERAKKVLTLAQEEAEKAHHSYIGPEHLLLSVLREREGLGAVVLGNLGVELDRVRETVEPMLTREETLVVQQIIPTSHVKKVIEIAFEEARRMGHNYVGTEHLLVGLIVEGQSIAARVLNDLGVDEKSVRAEIARVLLSQPGGEPASPRREGRPPPSGSLSALQAAAQELAALEGAQAAGPEHLLLVLAAPGTRLTKHLEASTLAEALARVTTQLQEVREAKLHKEQAITRQDREAAAQHGAEESRARVALAEAMAAWRQELS